MFIFARFLNGFVHGNNQSSTVSDCNESHNLILEDAQDRQLHPQLDGKFPGHYSLKTLIWKSVVCIV